jgi:superfamily II DNA or RNA helicase
MFRLETKSQREKYEVTVIDAVPPPCDIVLDKVVLKSSAYLSIPTDVVQRVKLENLLKEQCSAKKLNYFSGKLDYEPYFEKVVIRKEQVYKTPLLFWQLEGIRAKHVVDLRKEPTIMPAHIKIKPNFGLRDHQIQVHPLAMAQMLKAPHFSTTITMQCGAGKTIQAANILGTLRVRTFVGVPIIDLARQFKEEIQVVMDIPSHEIQLIGSEFPPPVPGKWIYICVFNSAMSTEHYTTKYADIISSCDLLVVDECHKFPAKCVKSLLKHFHGKYRLGLTATPQRNDGLSHMIFKLLGPQCVYVKREKPELGMWKMTQLDYHNPKHKGDILVKKRYGKGVERDRIAMMQRVCEDQVRTKAIAEFIVQHLEKDVLVLGDWKNILRDLVAEIEKLKLRSTYLYVGGGSKSKKAVLEKEAAFKDRNYIIATTGKAGCAMNLPRINYVVFVTSRIPGVLLEQGSGRALRKKCPKHMYYVNDVDTPYYTGKTHKCVSWFKKEGYQIMPSKTIGPLELPGSIKNHMQQTKRKLSEDANVVYKRKK